MKRAKHRGSYTNQHHARAHLKRVHILLLPAVLIWRIPTDVDDLVVLVGVVDGHGHVVVCRNDLRTQVSLLSAIQTTGLPEASTPLTSWKSSLNLCLSSCAYLSNIVSSNWSRLSTEYPQLCHH